MKQFLIVLLMLPALLISADAASLPEELLRAVPEEAELMMGELSFENEDDLISGAAKIWEAAKEQLLSAGREQLRAVAVILLVAVLCGTAESMLRGEIGQKAVSMAGTLAVTAVAAGDVTAFLGIGIEKIRELGRFSKVLLPTLSAAAAAGGAVGSASLHQVLTVFFADILLTVTETILVPMVYLFIGITAAEAVVREGRLKGLAELIKKTVVWALTVTLTLFASYLALGGAVAGRGLWKHCCDCQNGKGRQSAAQGACASDRRRAAGGQRRREL